MPGHTYRCLRTPDMIPLQSIVKIPGFDIPETVIRTRPACDGRTLVRTRWNLHLLDRDQLVEVLAVHVPGIGFLTPIDAAA